MRIVFSLLFVLCLIGIPSEKAFSAEDGFPAGVTIEGAHFTLTLQGGIDAENLISKLNVSETDQVLVNQKIDASSSASQLASMIEVLFNRASDTLDMHVYSLKAHIKVFNTHEELSQFYQRLFKTSLPCTGHAFYLHDYKTIYITAENFRREVIGHEMGHAIMSHYFVVQPSIKIQEVLAGYVEYQLRKSQ